MNDRSHRLRRVARKYALDCRIADCAAAQAERELRALVQQHQQLSAARHMMAIDCGQGRAADLAARALASARKRDAQQAIGRRDIIDRRINEAHKSEKRLAEIGQSSSAGGKPRRGKQA
ncbi:MAG: hypothetical protein KA199_05260 [Sphingorhabdus sp.]|nr:hypothetical protein [Sphingorhabdus sp.]